MKVKTLQEFVNEDNTSIQKDKLKAAIDKKQWSNAANLYNKWVEIDDKKAKQYFYSLDSDIKDEIKSKTKPDSESNSKYSPLFSVKDSSLEDANKKSDASLKEINSFETESNQNDKERIDTLNAKLAELQEKHKTAKTGKATINSNISDTKGSLVRLSLASKK